MTDITFSEVIPTDDQASELYALLLHRKHNISHQSLPLVEEHLSFVNSHPYRAWYIAYLEGQAIGSFYLSKDNTIGINLVSGDDVKNVSTVISYVKNYFTPLPAIKSVRSGYFTINVSPANRSLIKSLTEVGAEVLQITYSLK